MSGRPTESAHQSSTKKYRDDGSGNTLVATQIHGETSGGAVITLEATEDNALKVFDSISNSLVPAVYDFILLSYTGDNLTSVVFKTGGSGGATVSTLTLAYDGSDNLTSVTKT